MKKKKIFTKIVIAIVTLATVCASFVFPTFASEEDGEVLSAYDKARVVITSFSGWEMNWNCQVMENASLPSLYRPTYKEDFNTVTSTTTDTDLYVGFSGYEVSERMVSVDITIKFPRFTPYTYYVFYCDVVTSGIAKDDFYIHTPNNIGIGSKNGGLTVLTGEISSDGNFNGFIRIVPDKAISNFNYYIEVLEFATFDTIADRDAYISTYPSGSGLPSSGPVGGGDNTGGEETTTTPSTPIVPDVDTDEIYNEGYNDGYDVGYDEGYTDGFEEGAENGYHTGYDKGEEQGYTNGYADGFKDGSSGNTGSSGITNSLDYYNGSIINVYKGDKSPQNSKLIHTDTVDNSYHYDRIFTINELPIIPTELTDDGYCVTITFSEPIDFGLNLFSLYLEYVDGYYFDINNYISITFLSSHEEYASKGNNILAIDGYFYYVPSDNIDCGELDMVRIHINKNLFTALRNTGMAEVENMLYVRNNAEMTNSFAGKLNTYFYTLGYNKGYDYGYLDGEVKGYTDGYKEGYNVGYNNGVFGEEVEIHSFPDMFNGIAQVPVTIVTSLLGFEVFGINVMSVLIGLLTILLVAFLIKRFI